MACPGLHVRNIQEPQKCIHGETPRFGFRIGGVRGHGSWIPRAFNSSQHALRSSTTSSRRTVVFSHTSIRLSCAFPFTEVNDRFKFFAALPTPVPDTSADAARRRNIRDKNPGILSRRSL